MPVNILQLNIQSINNKTELLGKLLNLNSIDIALIQETWTKPNQKVKIKSYNTIHKSRENNQSTLTHQHQQIEQIELTTSINGEKLNLISFYNPNQENIHKSSQEFNLMLENNKFITNTIICGDINASSGLWNNNGNDDRLGKLISDQIIISPYAVLNDGSNTRMNLFNNSESAIDISVVSLDLVNNCVWKILEDSIGSDHKPILIQILNNNTNPIQKIFHNKTKIINTINDTSNIELNNITQFTNKINQIINCNTQRIKLDPRKTAKSWWNEYIERLWETKREKLRIYNRAKKINK